MPVKKLFIPEQDVILPVSMRYQLKDPLGELIVQQPSEQLKQLVQQEAPPLVVLVGDFCVKDYLEHGGQPDIAIIDKKTLRKPFEEIHFPEANYVKTTNPPAMITVEAWTTIRAVISHYLSEEKTHQATVLFIEGEEDLLVLPVVLEAPNDSFVVYGQPNEGIVLIRVTPATQEKFLQLLEQMMEQS